MLELRILSGLHRGATLPLIDAQLEIGSGDDADVVLVDPGIQERHATLCATDDAWLLTATEGELYAVDSNAKQTWIEIRPDGFARIGKVWITIVEAETEWQEPPAESFEIFADTEISCDSSEPALTLDSPATGVSSDQIHSNSTRRRKFSWTGRRALLVPIVTGTLLSLAAAAYAMTSRTSAGDYSKPLENRTRVETLNAAGGLDRVNDTPQEFGVPDEKAVPAVKTPMTQEELRNAFRNRLADAQLLKHFDLNLSDDSWELHGNMDDEEAVRFERILKVFLGEHHITFPVHAKVVTAEGMLPFKIRQVISGTYAGVVTDDGTRLYLGDEYKGIRMVAIQDNHLTFAGKRKIEVNW